MIIYKTTGQKYGYYDVYYAFYDSTDNKNYWIWYDATTALYYMSEVVGVPMARFDVATGLTQIGTTRYPEVYVYGASPVYYDSGIGSYIWNNSPTLMASRSIGFYIPYYGGAAPTVNWWQLYSTDTMRLFNAQIGDQALNFRWKKVTLATPTRLAVIGRYCSTLTGVYVPVTTGGGQPTGNRYVGWRTLPISDGTTIRNLCETSTEKNSKSVFKFFTTDIGLRYCWYNQTRWIISPVMGTSDQYVGYWEKTTTGGSVDGTYNLVFSQPTPPIDVPTPATYTVTNTETYSELLPYDSLRSSAVMKYAEVALWL